MPKRPILTASPSNICARCRHRLLQQPPRRFQHTSTTISANAPTAPPPPSGAARLTSRRLISIHGPTTPKFLQGLITANVSESRQAGFYAAFLTAPGKVLVDVFVYPTLGTSWARETCGASNSGAAGETAKGGEGAEVPGFLIEVDAGLAGGLVKHLRRHKLRDKFSLRLLEEGELDVWSSWRGEERWTAHSASSPSSLAGDRQLSLMDMRAPGMGQRVLAPSRSQASGNGLLDVLGEVDEVSAEVYRLRRYLKGVPEGQAEIPWDESLPMNHNIDLMGGIDFKKGCYVGQELTIRTHHTGVVRRRILPIMLYQRGQDAEAPRALEYHESSGLSLPEGRMDIRRDDHRRKPTGKALAAIGNVGLAMCRLEQMTDLTISSEGSSFSSEDRFVVETADGQEMGVKAFVPDWLRGQIREPRLQRRVE